MTHDQIVAYLDTPVFVECRELQELLWLTLLDAAEVLLVVTPVVFKQLDRLKDKPGMPRGKRERAGKATRDLERLLFPGSAPTPSSPARVRENVRIVYRDSRNPDSFQRYNLDPENEDHQLLSYALSAPENHVCIVSTDSGPRVAAKQHGLEAYNPPKEWQLGSAVDEDERELRSLRQRVAKLEARIPKLALQFKNATQLLKVVAPAPYDVTAEFIEDWMPNVYAMYPTYDAPGSLHKLNIGVSLHGRPSQSRIQHYDDSLADFYKVIREKLPELFYYHNEVDRHVLIDALELVNIGTSPATNIEIVMSLPAGIDAQENMPQRPNTPRPPPLPRPNTISDLLGGFHTNANSAIDASFLKSLTWNPPRWTIDGPLVRFSLPKVRHSETKPLPMLILRWQEGEPIKPFQVEFKVYADEIEEILTGKLNIAASQGDEQRPFNLHEYIEGGS